MLNGVFLNGVFILGSPFLSLGAHIAILVPPVLAVLACLAFPFIVSFPGSIFNKIMGALLSGSAFLSVIMLVIIFNHIDDLGTTHHIGWSILAVLLGVHIGIGPFVTLLGLMLLFIGGLVEVLSKDQPSSNFNSEAVSWAQMR